MTSFLRRLRERPRTFAAVADALVALLLLIAIWSELTGGFGTTVAGVRISMNTIWRLVLWAAVIATIRHLAVPRPSILDRVIDPGAAASEHARIATAPGRPTAARLKEALLVVGLFFVTIAIVVPVQFARPYDVPDQGDPLFSVWRLAWVAHQLPVDPLRLFDANIFHPHQRTLAFSDAMLVPALAGSPLLWLGVHQLLVYNLLFLASIVASGAATFLLMRALTGRVAAGVISGLLFELCAFRFLHYSHLELQVAMWMPLALYWFHRAVVTGQVRFGLLTGLAVALQALSSLYYGVFFATFLAVVAAGLAAARQLDVRRLARPALAAAALAAVLVLPLTVPYWQSRAQVGERDEGTVHAYSATPAELFAPHSRSVYYGWLPQAGNGERELFPGFLPLVLAAIALWPPLSPIRLAYGAGLMFALDASLGMNGEVYHWLYDLMPGFHAFRSPARYGMISALALSVLGGFAVARAGNWLGASRYRAAVALCAIAIVIESTPALSLEEVWRTPPPIYAALPTDRHAILAEFPFPETDGGLWGECRFMYFSTFHFHRLLNGNSGFFPPDYHALRDRMLEFPTDASMRLLREYGAEYLSINALFYERSAYGRIVSALDARPDAKLVSQHQWEGHDVRLYQLVAPGRARQ